MGDLRFLADAYEVEDVQRALLKISDKYSGEIKNVEEGGARYLTVAIRALDDSLGAPNSVLRNFEIEVQDQALRRKIKKETEQQRNLILAHTFSHLTGSSDE